MRNSVEVDDVVSNDFIVMANSLLFLQYNISSFFLNYHNLLEWVLSSPLKASQLFGKLLLVQIPRWDGTSKIIEKI